MKKIPLIFLTVTGLAWGQLAGDLLTNAEINAIRDLFDTQYDISLKYGVTPAIEGVTYYEDLGPNDGEVTLGFLRLLKAEYEKYPASLVKAFGGFSINLVKTFNAAAAGTGGVHTPSHNIFYAIGRLRLADPYPRLLIHHELFHGLDRQFTTSGSPTEERTWNSLQPAGHDWGGGGSKYIRLGITVANADSHPFPGFVSFYSTASQAEDKAEIWADLCVMEKRKELEAWILTDPILSKKVKAIRAFAGQFPTPLGDAFFKTVTNLPIAAAPPTIRADAPGGDLEGVVLLDGKPFAGATVSLGSGVFVGSNFPSLAKPRIEPWSKGAVTSSEDGTWRIPRPPAKRSPWVFAYVDADGDGQIGPGDLASDLNSPALTNLQKRLHLKRVCRADFTLAYSGVSPIEKPAGSYQTGRGCGSLVFLSRNTWSFPDFSGKQSVLALIERDTLDWELHYFLKSRTAGQEGGLEGSLSLSFRWVKGDAQASSIQGGELLFRP